MLRNTQPIEKIVRSDGSSLAVNNVFHTIQGEGPFTGTPAVFVRLAGCNLQCPACDTEYTKRHEMPVEKVVNWVRHHQTGGLVVITGGEPFRQQIQPLINRLRLLDYFVQVESNGTLPCEDDFKLWSKNVGARFGQYLVCSPKTPKINTKISKNVCAYKYVVNAGAIAEDGLPTRVLGNDHTAAHVARPQAGFLGPVYVQPADNQDVTINQMNLRAAIDSCMTHGYILQLQLHKILEME